MNIKHKQQTDGSPIKRSRGAVITSAVALLSFGGMFAVAQPASATVTNHLYRLWLQLRLRLWKSCEQVVLDDGRQAITARTTWRTA